MPTPTPAMFAGRKATPSTPSEPSESGGSDVKKETRPRVPRLLVNHPELEEIMTRLKEDEQINKRHGWYDRNRNGKGRLPKGTKPNPPRKTNKEKN